MASDDPSLPAATASSQVAEFLRKVGQTPVPTGGGRGRLVFALDATASRERTWREASRIQEQMFLETAELGGLEVQLVYYRGLAECKASRWLSDADGLLVAMRKVHCLGGQTQIGRVLRHAVVESAKRRVNALVFIGDCMEENVDSLCATAGELGVIGVPVFLFHEGSDPVAAEAFARIAKLSGGACCHFDASSPLQLKALLGAVAVFAGGGRQALAEYGRRQGGIVLRLTNQMAGG